jgi:hypothetical protein
MGWVLVFDLDETLIATKKKYENGKYYISDIQLNKPLFEIIFHAKALKPGGKVDAILLLTNNTNVPSEYGDMRMGFLDIIDLVVRKKYGEGFDEIFDNIYTGTANNMKKRGYNLVPFRPFGNKVSPAYSLNIVQGSTTYNTRGNVNESSSGIYKMFNYRPRKDIATIRQMVSELNKDISLDSLEDRIFFFDDEPREHVLQGELEGHGGKYITIVPQFGKGEDQTDLTDVYAALDMDMPHQAKGGARKRRTVRKKKQLRRTKKRINFYI